MQILVRVLLEKVTALLEVRQTRLRCSQRQSIDLQVGSPESNSQKWDRERHKRRNRAGEETLAV